MVSVKSVSIERAMLCWERHYFKEQISFLKRKHLCSESQIRILIKKMVQHNLYFNWLWMSSDLRKWEEGHNELPLNPSSAKLCYHIHSIFFFCSCDTLQKEKALLCIYRLDCHLTIIPLIHDHASWVTVHKLLDKALVFVFERKIQQNVCTKT